MRLEHHLVGGYVRYISPHIIIINIKLALRFHALLIVTIVNKAIRVFPPSTAHPNQR